ncbi:tubulin folding cofactor A [Conoideocrella luteorostrata]|uniref:Tubulin-specific chaperone A n=1 Tax=Conoideocrella luteorostrata TaxID=1105319 RepID=A0AAJ0CLC4_9HYPO|nr:tubulin folding cofactor A [Conoideocrella luteorostrata]
MPPPSQLAIATSSVSRLLKEEGSYHKELADQEVQVAKLEESIKNGGDNEDGNAEFMLKQNKIALEQTKAVFGPLRERINAAVIKLEDQIGLAEEAGGAEGLDNARKVLEEAKAS